jgi:alpha-methylacyl-CoA racemase
MAAADRPEGGTVTNSHQHADAGAPLAGISVVDCSELSPGPYATQLLADLGAQVVVVERPTAQRADPPPAAQQLLTLRRGKRSIVLDLKQPQAVQVLQELIARSDVFVEGWRPGVADRLGAGFAELRRHNPTLIYCSITGYGQDGPHRDLAGHDLNYLAMSGLLGMVGHGPAGPVPPLNLLADYAGGGLAAAFAIMVALYNRSQGSDIGHLDVSMTDSVLSFLGPHLSQATLTGTFPQPGEHRLGGELPYYRSYQCADGEWISVAALEPKFFAGLCRELSTPEFADLQHDQSSHPAMAEVFARAFLTDSRDAWFVRLQPHTCVAPVLRLAELAQATPEQAAGRLMRVTAAGQETVQPACVPGFGKRSTMNAPSGPLPGEHTEDILVSLGYGQAQISDLLRLGAAGAYSAVPS